MNSGKLAIKVAFFAGAAAGVGIAAGCLLLGLAGLLATLTAFVAAGFTGVLIFDLAPVSCICIARTTGGFLLLRYAFSFAVPPFVAIGLGIGLCFALPAAAGFELSFVSCGAFVSPLAAGLHTKK